MNIFVLCPGRSGSKTFIKACEHISNYTSSHESRPTKLGKQRFEYPDNHIEADNRLSWQLGGLDAAYGNDALYVHLKRDKDAIAKSYSKRLDLRSSIIYLYCYGIKMTSPKSLNKDLIFKMSLDYVDTVESNINHFLKDKDLKVSINLENPDESFARFLKMIDAKCDLDTCLKEFRIKHNASPKNRTINNIKRRLYKLIYGK